LDSQQYHFIGWINKFINNDIKIIIERFNIKIPAKNCRQYPKNRFLVAIAREF